MQAALVISQETRLLSSVDLKNLERLTVEAPLDDQDFASYEISEQRRMAIVLLLTEISAIRENYVFPG